jgi:uncharacterized damage-inducible protein DinB
MSCLVLFAYEQDAHHKTLDSLKAAEHEYADNEEFRKAVDLAAHVTTCRTMWLERLRETGTRPDTLFPTGLPLEEVVNAFDRMHRSWTTYLDDVTDDVLEHRFEYVAYDGRRFADTVRNVFTQLFAHSSYHRGQIALLLRGVGAEPAATDFVFWTRQAHIEMALNRR